LENKPLTVQSDFSLLLDRHSQNFAECRDALLGFAELTKCLDHFYTYTLTRLSLWNAAALGMGHEQILQVLKTFSKYEVPTVVVNEVRDACALYGVFILDKIEGRLTLIVKDSRYAPLVCSELRINQERLNNGVPSPSGEIHFLIAEEARGRTKVRLMKVGLPCEDLAGYQNGDPLDVELKDRSKLRDYQREATEIFYSSGSNKGGSGVIVLPCGAGKTMVGIDAIGLLKTKTLILTPSISSLRQWRSELLKWTNLLPEKIAEYSGESKSIAPVTITTYQLLTTRLKKNNNLSHLENLSKEAWGLVIYDEVHLLPAEVFQLASLVQSKRRLGLTATLVREDNKEDEVFTLIGPKKFDLPWKTLEEQGWIAKATCVEVRVGLNSDESARISLADKKEAYKIAATSEAKLEATIEILKRHTEEPVIIIGMYLDQLNLLALKTDFPLVTGATPQKVRDEIFKSFNNGEIKTLILSKVGNSAIDLPEAAVAIQVSGMFGSRQEEAQRLGRVVRPKKDGGQAKFYSLVTKDSPEESFAFRRQLFLVEQGYEYQVEELA
jgi:DNA excision repair protein ERCC-3